ncbi:hypothetical protein QBC39DRAFT_376987 [Podospora conica]|nr:hypothetical protein QBC39DRAFT_376987 [Schizothecium conicum]
MAPSCALRSRGVTTELFIRTRNSQLHVTNLPRSTSEDDLSTLFSKAGKVASIRIMRDISGRSRGTGFVVVETKEAVDEALKTLDKVILDNHAIKVELGCSSWDGGVLVDEGPVHVGLPDGAGRRGGQFHPGTANDQGPGYYTVSLFSSIGV